MKFSRNHPVFIHKQEAIHYGMAFKLAVARAAGELIGGFSELTGRIAQHARPHKKRGRPEVLVTS
ncbi:hypothetical protein [Paenibacillus chitinolyticus]